MEDERSFYCGVTQMLKCDLTRIRYNDTFPPTAGDWVVWDCEFEGIQDTYPTYAEARVVYEARVKHHMEKANANL